MINIQDRQAFTDISVIIQMMSKSMKSKINPNFIKLIEENKDTQYVSRIDKNIPLKEQTLNENTKMILALIYRDYLCTNDMRIEILKQEKKEIEKKEEEKRKKYNSDNIFKNRKLKKEELAVSKERESQSNLPIEIKKGNIIIKFLKFIKGIFHLN